MRKDIKDIKKWLPIFTAIINTFEFYVLSLRLYHNSLCSITQIYFQILFLEKKMAENADKINCSITLITLSPGLMSV